MTCRGGTANRKCEGGEKYKATEGTESNSGSDGHGAHDFISKMKSALRAHQRREHRDHRQSHHAGGEPTEIPQAPPHREAPHDLRAHAISIITAMIGTEITPLITALQMSALTGSISVKLSATPIVVAAMRMP